MDSARAPSLVVLGAGGLFGGYLLDALRAGGFRVRAAVHRPTSVDRANAQGADEVVVADLGDPGDARRALEGAELVFMIPPAFHPDEDDLVTRALDAAGRAGVRRFVYLSVLHPHTPGLLHHMRKAAAEVAVRDSGLDWSILQPSMFAEIVLSTWGRAAPGVVSVPFDVRQTFSLIHLPDLAEVSLHVLAQPGHSSATYELAGPSTSLLDAIGAAGRARGVRLEARTIDVTGAPLPPGVVEGTSQARDMRAMWREYDQHGLRGNSNIVRTLLGREPRTFAEAAAMFYAGGHA